MQSDSAQNKNSIALLGFLLQFFPISVFASYAFSNGQPTPHRWFEAFVLGATLSGIRLGYLHWKNIPINPIVLGTDLYLFFGFFACLSGQRVLTDILAAMQAAGFLVMIFIAGAWATVFSSRGYVLANNGDRKAIKRASLILLVITGISVGISFFFRGNTTYSGVLPAVFIAVSQRVLRKKVSA